MKKILISGSSGFVGSRVLHQWQGRAELFTFPRGSLAAADETTIRRFAETVQPDVILHLAATSGGIPACQRRTACLDGKSCTGHRGQTDLIQLGSGVRRCDPARPPA